jgi:glyoxylase I family protein
MGQRVHHSAVCVRDLDASLRFYREGLGLDVLMDEHFVGDWPVLFGGNATRLHSVFLGDASRPDAGIVELVVFDGASRSALPVTVDGGEPADGFFLLSFFVEVDDALRRLAELGFTGARRIEQPSPRGPVPMATVRDPDGVLVELIGAAPA